MITAYSTLATQRMRGNTPATEHSCRRGRADGRLRLPLRDEIRHAHSLVPLFGILHDRRLSQPLERVELGNPRGDARAKEVLSLFEFARNWGT